MLRLTDRFRFNDRDLKNIGILFAVFLSIIVLTVFQDFLDSYRKGYDFYLCESVLFKTIWFLFIPLLPILSRSLKNQPTDTLVKKLTFIAVPILVHFVFLSLIFVMISIVFFEGNYGLKKIVSYTFSNDFYLLIIIYSGFVFSHHYFFKTRDGLPQSKLISFAEKLTITNGKNYTIIPVDEIYQISAETPYIAIRLESKKHLHTATLKSIATQLDSQVFVRVHKSTIVNLDKVETFKSRLNGDYDLVLKNSDEVRLSRTYAPNFKRHFMNGNRVTS